MSAAQPESRPDRAEIRDRLRAFAARWDQRPGNEQQEAQRFLLDLLECYGVDTKGTDFTFEHHYPDGSRADLYWPELLLVEMKSASETDRLILHRGQAFRYWEQSADSAKNVRSPRWLVLCSFRRLEIWQPGEFPGAPRVTVDLIDLPERLEVLDFLRRREPDFQRNAADLASEAVGATASLYRSMIGRGVDPILARDFTLQAAWCMFAEDLDLLPEDNFAAVVSLLRRNPDLSSFDQLGGLFEWLGRDGERPTSGMYRGVPYANGDLFASTARVELAAEEVELLDLGSRADWSLVEPSIFGGLLQSSLGIDRRRLMGAHYTPEAEIAKIVGPTIVEPWQTRIAALATAGDAALAMDELAAFRVLDPACGCGNFLYVAYRELRRLEVALVEKARALHRAEGLALPDPLPRVTLSNMLGIEKDPFAAALARVVLWIGHKQVVDSLGLTESALPLPQLTGIVQGDALVIDWPECEAIVGNPPFHGTKTMREHLGAAYLKMLQRDFGVGVTDYCVYWFRKAHAHLGDGRRAGLVATNSLAEGKNREASLDHIVATGGTILNAIRSQPWPGEAKVFVSIVNWQKEMDGPEQPVLNGVGVEGITSELRPGRERPSDVDLPANRGRQFFGVVPGAGGDGFLLSPQEAHVLLEHNDADYSEVVRPYLIGDDITSNPDIAPTRWVIDFGERSLEEAGHWTEALAIVRRHVKPHRDSHPKAREREQWWKHSRSVRALFAALGPLRRFIACPATSKRVFMVWCEPRWCPSNATSVFAFEDDYAFGVLQSRVHTVWASSRSTALKADPRYTVKSFASFPWPDPTPDARNVIGSLGAQIAEMRRELCWGRAVGLTKLYNAVEEGAHAELAELHSRLDSAVTEGFGWRPETARDDDAIVAQLGELNRAVASGEKEYDPFPSSAAASLFDLGEQ